LELGRITRFGFVGIAATVVYVGTSFTGNEVFGIPPVGHRWIPITNYLANRFWVFLPGLRRALQTPQ
jgi:putative flippase GtrA